jgi:nucleoid DNA-binding protein
VQKTFALPTRKQAEEIVAKFISCLEDTLLHHLGDDGFAMKLNSFGKFSVRHRHASRRRITFTGDVREIPPRRKIKFISLGKLRRLERAHMAQAIKPNVVYHADWGGEEKRWSARAALGTDGRYTAFAPEPVGPPGSLIGQLRKEAGHNGCAFAGFEFPVGVPASYAERAGVSSFRSLVKRLGHRNRKECYSVCDEANQI